MDHPSQTKYYRLVGNVMALVGLVLLAVAIFGDTEDAAPFVFTLGAFFLLLCAIYYGVHGVAVVLHDHERWRRSLD